MPLPSLKSCSPCELSINLGCSGGDERTFDRVVHCLLPVYPALALASEREVQGFTCLVGYGNALYPFLDALLTLDAARFGYVPRQWYNRTACTPLPDAVVTSPLAPTAVRLLHRSVRIQIAPRPWPTPPTKQQLLLLVRHGTRKFVDKDAVVGRLSQRLSGKRVLEFHGNESMQQQIRLFASSSAVVGIHGAGLANLVFNVEPVCVLEINTYMSSEVQKDGRGLGRGAGLALFRTNAVAALLWNAANIRWQSYRVPLNQLVSHNVISDDEGEGDDDARAAQVNNTLPSTSSALIKREALLNQLRTVHGGGKFDKRDRYVKRLTYVLYEHDLDNIASATGSCIDWIATGSTEDKNRDQVSDVNRSVAELVQADETNFTQAEHVRENLKIVKLVHSFVRR